MMFERARALGRQLHLPRARGMELTSSPGLHYGYVVLLSCVAVVAASVGLSRWGYTLIMPDMRERLGLTYAQSGMLASGELVGFTAAALFVGVLSKRVGLRKTVSTSLSLSAGAAILAGLSPEFWTAMLARTVGGAGAAGGYVVALSLASTWFARRYRGLAAGFMFSGTWLGMTVGGIVLPPAMAAGGDEGWRFGWFAVGAAILGSTVVAGVLLRTDPAEKGLRPLWSGTDSGGASNTSRPVTPGTSGPIWQVCALWHFAAWYGAYGVSYVIYASFFAGHLLGNGLTGAEAGRLWALMGMVGLPSAPAWGLLSDRFGRRQTVVLAFVAQSTSYLVFALGSGPLAYTLSLLLFGSTAAAVGTVIAASVGDYVDAPVVPSALGLLTLVFGVSQAIGPWLAGALADATGSFVPSLLLASLVALAGALAAGLLVVQGAEGTSAKGRRNVAANHHPSGH